MVCWMTEGRDLRTGSRLGVKHTTRAGKAVVRDLQGRLDVNPLPGDEGAAGLGLNDIGRVSMRMTQPLFHDPYGRNRETGGFILIDETPNTTVGAGGINTA